MLEKFETLKLRANSKVEKKKLGEQLIDLENQKTLTLTQRNEVQKYQQLSKQIAEVEAAVSAIADDYEDMTTVLNALGNEVIVNAVNINQIPGVSEVSEVSEVSDSSSIEAISVALVHMTEISNPPEVAINSLKS
jgi:hypothetical protein